ncbi:hypothetical protein QN277_002417 [Acacia crassicarpa]|uniref:Leucine-rich repeat-containing N-terminal plant-type domain-containing protein n=1 Tax=Acacia crassicarpa TaxID=499986 RepID=A0AAE1THW5_9FABA|nr:hypothetical protein QN277_002417 [Acacia crassicarpa]
MYYSNSVKLLRATVLVWVLVLQQVNSCKEKERGALLELKKGLVDDFGILSSWDDSPDCCSWWGISCSNQTGQVVELDLHAREYDKPLRGLVALKERGKLERVHFGGVKIRSASLE